MHEVTLHVSAGPTEGQLDLHVESGGKMTPAETVTLSPHAISSFAQLRDEPWDATCYQDARAALHAALVPAREAYASLVLAAPNDTKELPPVRFRVSSGDAAAHLPPWELLTLLTQDSRKILEVTPGETGHWQPVRFAARNATSAEPPDQDTRVLLVLGSQWQRPGTRDARPFVLDALRHLITYDVDLRLAVSPSQRALLDSYLESDRDLVDVRRVLRDDRHCLSLDSCDTLLDHLRVGSTQGDDPPTARRGPYDVVVLLGRALVRVPTMESNIPTRADITSQDDAIGFDLGLAGTNAANRGPTWEQLAAALAHGQTRAVIVYACMVGPTSALTLLRATDHVLVTGARLVVADALASLNALCQALLHERLDIETVARRARSAFPVDRAWILQRWTRTSSLRVVLDRASVEVVRLARGVRKCGAVLREDPQTRNRYERSLSQWLDKCPDSRRATADGFYTRAWCRLTDGKVVAAIRDWLRARLAALEIPDPDVAQQSLKRIHENVDRLNGRVSQHVTRFLRKGDFEATACQDLLRRLGPRTTP